jgi:sorting nexin-1/2
MQTSAKEYRSGEVTVTRRFREFLWLAEELTNNNPGIIVPPAPEKMALGRFEEDFVANRCVLLHRMLQNIVAHPVLQRDPSLRIFLESETFKYEVQDKKKKEDGGKSSSAFSFMSKIGDAVSNATSIVSTKVDDPDPYFENKRIYVEELETQFKNLLKAVDGLIKQREGKSILFYVCRTELC